MKHILILIAVLPFFCYSQSLSHERIAKIKSCTVRIAIEGSDEMGTGFFIDNSGSTLTCWHVIRSAFIFTNGNLTDIKKIYAQTLDGKNHEVNIPISFTQEKAINAQLFDYCLLTPPKSFKTPFLKLGDYNKCEKGDKIYTCGYPLGLYDQFVSVGMISTKKYDTLRTNPKILIKDNCLMDLTLNRGNSGGAIVKEGKTVNEDEVIGIADYIINMYQKPYQKLEEILNRPSQGGVFIMGVPMKEFMTLLLNAVASSTNGISGCISINHFKKNVEGLYSDYK